MKTFTLYIFCFLTISVGTRVALLLLEKYPRRMTVPRWIDIVYLVAFLTAACWAGALLSGGAR